MAILINGVQVAGVGLPGKDGIDGKDATINGVSALTLTATGGIKGQQSGDTYTLDGSGLMEKVNGLQGQFLGFTSENVVGAVDAPAGVTSFNGRTGVVTPQSGDYTASMVGAAPTSHTHSASQISSGIFSIARGGTGVSNMVGTDYSTNRPRGIVLQSSTPSSVSNGCIVGVYE